MCQNEEIYYKGRKLEHFIDMKLKHEADSRLSTAMMHITQQYLEPNPGTRERFNRQNLVFLICFGSQHFPAIIESACLIILADATTAP